jgi:hypothetical protein
LSAPSNLEGKIALPRRQSKTTCSKEDGKSGKFWQKLSGFVRKGKGTKVVGRLVDGQVGKTLDLKTKKNSFGRKEHSSLQARLRVMRPLPVSLSVCHSESGLVNAKHREEGLYTHIYLYIN